MHSVYCWFLMKEEKPEHLGETREKIELDPHTASNTESKPGHIGGIQSRAIPVSNWHITLE